MLYVYGATEAGQMAPVPPGIDGAPVRLLEVAGLALAVSDVDEAPAPTQQRLRQHLGVSMALQQEGGVVPFRFGNVLGSEAEARRVVEARVAELRRKLAAVSGCVEMSIRAPLATTQQSQDAARPGTAYLREKRRQLALSDDLRQTAGDTAKDWRAEIRDGELRAACLVPAARVAELQARLRGRATVSGPWPPSSFV